MKMMAAVVMAVLTAAMRVAIGGEVYKVGDSAGWTNVGNVDYKAWAANKVFRVNDTIVFFYNKEFHDVARVSYTDYLTCNGAAPFATFTSGNDTFPIKYPGHYYFICTYPGHCESGQKVDIRVPLAAAPPSGSGCSPAPLQPLPFPYPPPHIPTPVPSPSPSPAIPSPSHSPPLKESTPPRPPVATPPSPPHKSRTSELVVDMKVLTASVMAVAIFLVDLSC